MIPDQLNDCIKVYDKSRGLLIEEDNELFEKYEYYVRMNIGSKPTNNIWWDPIESFFFSSDITWWRNTTEFSFFVDPPKFDTDIRWGIPHAERYLVQSIGLPNTRSSEAILSTNIPQIFRDKRVMIIGAGQSATSNWKSKSFDILATCGAFYQSSLFDDVNVDFALLGPNQELSNFQVQAWFRKHKTIACLEGGSSPFKSEDEIQQFVKAFPEQISYFHLRYFSKLGACMRLVVLAALASATEIIVAGLDGDPKLGEHVFEPGKQPTGCPLLPGATSRYRREFVLGFEYIKESFPDVKIVNMGDNEKFQHCNQWIDVSRKLWK